MVVCPTTHIREDAQINGKWNIDRRQFTRRKWQTTILSRTPTTMPIDKAQGEANEAHLCLVVAALKMCIWYWLTRSKCWWRRRRWSQGDWERWGGKLTQLLKRDNRAHHRTQWRWWNGRNRIEFPLNVIRRVDTFSANSNRKKFVRPARGDGTAKVIKKCIYIYTVQCEIYIHPYIFRFTNLYRHPLG